MSLSPILFPTKPAFLKVNQADEDRYVGVSGTVKLRCIDGFVVLLSGLKMVCHYLQVTFHVKYWKYI